jgi:anti-sigma B factor antagonist
MADTSSSRRGYRIKALGWYDAGSMSCTITTRDIEGVTVFDIAGRMSFPEPKLQKMVAAQVQTGRVSLVLNLGGVTYVDSFGLQDLVSAYNAVKTAGGKMVLLGPIPNVKKTIDITMKGIFQFFDDEAAAIQAVLP